MTTPNEQHVQHIINIDIKNLHSGYNYFSLHILRFMLKADCDNRKKLQLVYPNHFEALNRTGYFNPPYGYDEKSIPPDSSYSRAHKIGQKMPVHVNKSVKSQAAMKQAIV